MFNDIIGESKKEEKKGIVADTEDIKRIILGRSTDQNCDSCKHGSHLLSNYPGKVLCDMYNRHKDLDYCCRNWDKYK